MQLTDTTRARIAEMLAEGATNAAIAAELGIGKDTAARHRARLGYGPASQPRRDRSPLTLEQKWEQYTRTVEGGHVEWTGRRRADTGTMVFTHHQREHTARSVAFLIRNGRPARGQVTAECDAAEWCVSPAHVEDTPSRTKLREALAIVQGTASPLTECTRGHDVATHRRYDRQGRPYCATCHAEAALARKAAA
ncbi:helix-turn-helix domain-containing protein [Streptomyces sp. NPDC057403]|uniref:helix-turn-helix domain-containing protein n=1 Tax=Streptomyces sp. NPDC057403 TaxID=3346119 RepID=UPI0036A207E6